MGFVKAEKIPTTNKTSKHGVNDGIYHKLSHEYACLFPSRMLCYLNYTGRERDG